MNFKLFSIITTLALQFLMPGHSLAYERTSTGYVSSVTPTSVVMDGISHRFRPNQEERAPVEVQCVVKDKRIDCEELAQINPRKRAKAKITFDNAGYVVRVQILDVLK